jgi:hypothetical protein
LKMTLSKISILLFTALTARAQQSRDFAPATLIEAVEYEPCDYYCGPLNHPTTAYCVYVDDQIVVGERAGFLWFGENDATSMRNLVGKQITARFDARSIWIGESGQRAIKMKRGANFEQFADTRCVVEVHRPKLAIAAKVTRPSNLPVDAFPLAGEQGGDIQYRSAFVWFACAAKPTMGTIDCLKWYPAGASRGVERYCARTVDGASVPSDFRIDRLASREGRIVLTSGGILLFDHRGRLNDELIHPAEACR